MVPLSMKRQSKQRLKGGRVVEKQRGFAWNFHLAAVRNYAEGPKPSLDAEVK